MLSKHGFDTSNERSDLMRKIKGVDTKPEISLRKALWAIGLRYRKNVRRLPGNPDIVFMKAKTVIFVDGEFWHGYRWTEKKPKIKSNRDYWIKKIEGNIARDRRNRKELRLAGFTVLRFWEHEIKSDLSKCVARIVKILNSQQKFLSDR